MSGIRMVRSRQERIPYTDPAGDQQHVSLQHVSLLVWEIWADGRLIGETTDPEAVPSILRHPSNTPQPDPVYDEAPMSRILVGLAWCGAIYIAAAVIWWWLT